MMIEYQWAMVIASSLLMFLISPVAKTTQTFFSGASRQARNPSVLLVTTSLVMSWFMAKSVSNTADLAARFGLLGGITYALYYLSFMVAGVLIYRMREKGGFGSIHHFLQSRFGRGAVLAFSGLIGLRLFNEVWSNTAVIGSYFGQPGSRPYLLAVVLFTGLTLAYSLKGGLRSSLITDAIQMGLFGILLFVVLSLLTQAQGRVGEWMQTGNWSTATGLNLFFVVLIQIFSYPFHDPILTDRGFITDSKTTLKSYALATLIGFCGISLFGLIGIYAGSMGISEQAALGVSRSLGIWGMLLMNVIMITSAASTLDSTFTSVAKLVVVDLNARGNITLNRGRWVMILVAIAGSLPLIFSPAILSATTVSGTMVLGLAPIFLFWRLKAPPLSFHLAYWTGIAAGLVLMLDGLPAGWYLSQGPYSALLSMNVYGSLACFAAYLIPYWLGLWRHTRQSKSQS
ncbi:MAG: sodium:solute symporter [Bacteroidetes bacterium]|nr:MAG: sodium:solute symporter [Bacteroidota bacterium]